MNAIRSSKGLTLVEVLIASAVSSLILGVLISLYLGAQECFAVGGTYARIHSHARSAMAYLERDIRDSIDAKINGAGTSLRLTLDLPSVDSAGDVIDISSKEDTVRYSFNVTDYTECLADLVRTVTCGAGSARPSGSRVIAKDVYYGPEDACNPPGTNFAVNGDKVAVVISTKETLFNHTRTETLKTSLRKRN